MLYNNYVNKSQLSWELYEATKGIDSKGKDWYFRFDYDNKMSCKYILSITSNLMIQLRLF